MEMKGMNFFRRFFAIGLFIMLIVISTCGCIGPKTGIRIKKLDKTPSTFINMTEKQMNIFPLLKEAIQTNKTVKVSSPSHEVSQLQGILRYFGTPNIKYQNEYYDIHIIYIDL
jgi:hypothetical protein